MLTKEDDVEMHDLEEDEVCLGGHRRKQYSTAQISGQIKTLQNWMKTVRASYDDDEDVEQGRNF